MVLYVAGDVDKGLLGRDTLIRDVHYQLMHVLKCTIHLFINVGLEVAVCLSSVVHMYCIPSFTSI